MKPSTPQQAFWQEWIFPLLLPQKHRRTTDQLGSTSSSLYDIVCRDNRLGTRANICCIPLLLQRRHGPDLSPSSVFHVGNQSGRGSGGEGARGGREKTEKKESQGDSSSAISSECLWKRRRLVVARRSARLPPVPQWRSPFVRALPTSPWASHSVLIGVINKGEVRLSDENKGVEGKKIMNNNNETMCFIAVGCCGCALQHHPPCKEPNQKHSRALMKKSRGELWGWV